MAITMMCLGVESTAHTFGAGVVDSDGKILSNVRDSHAPAAGGIHPGEAAKHHRAVAADVISAAFQKAGIAENDVDVIAFSQGPGLPPCLREGLAVAKKLAVGFKKPLIGVNHCLAHVEIGRLATGCRDPVVLYVSGGNTQLIAFAEGRYRVFGETLDISAGNAQDKLGRAFGLAHPPGRFMDGLAAKGKWIELPYVVKGMDLSFSGIVTQALKKFREGCSMEDVAFSFQEVAFSMLCEVAERAMAHTEKEELLLTGGVAASQRLQEKLGIMCRERGATLFATPAELAGDNGAMIAWAGILQHKSASVAFDELAAGKTDIVPRWRIDEVETGWMG